MPFTLPLKDANHLGVSKNLLSPRFNHQMGTMYMEQEMYNVDSDISKSILMQKNKSEDGHIWSWGVRLFRIIGLSDSQMQASIVTLTNESSS